MGARKSSAVGPSKPGSGIMKGSTSRPDPTNKPGPRVTIATAIPTALSPVPVAREDLKIDWRTIHSLGTFFLCFVPFFFSPSVCVICCFLPIFRFLVLHPSLYPSCFSLSHLFALFICLMSTFVNFPILLNNRYDVRHLLSGSQGHQGRLWGSRICGETV